MTIATILSYCTNDFRFISKCIQEAKLFSKQILVPVCDHFFDGTEENRHLLEQTYAEHPDCQFIEFAYLPDRIYSRYHKVGPKDIDWPNFWAATARYIGWQYLDPSIEWILFLDSDEIIEGASFLEWLKEGTYRNFEVQRLASYFYALQPTWRSKKAVNLSLLVKREAFAPLTLFNELERLGAYMSHTGPKREKVVGLKGLPMVHHYSWVRTKEECLCKTRTWSHRSDADWPVAIKEAFEGKLERLVGPSHEFEIVEPPYFDPFTRPSVMKINENHLFRKEIENALL